MSYWYVTSKCQNVSWPLTIEDFASPKLIDFRSIIASCLAHMSFCVFTDLLYIIAPTPTIVAMITAAPTQMPTIALVGIDCVFTTWACASGFTAFAGFKTGAEITFATLIFLGFFTFSKNEVGLYWWRSCSIFEKFSFKYRLFNRKSHSVISYASSDLCQICDDSSGTSGTSLVKTSRGCRPDFHIDNDTIYHEW